MTKELKVGDFVEWHSNSGLLSYWFGGTVESLTSKTAWIKPTNDSVFEKYGIVKRSINNLKI